MSALISCYNLEDVVKSLSMIVRNENVMTTDSNLYH